MTLGANQIAAYAADLLDTEEQIEALQGSKRDLYASIRDEHGKADALSLKRAVKLSRMDPEKRDEAEAIDTEAQRMLDIIERAARAPRATRAREIIEQIPADEAEDQSTGEAGERHSREQITATEAPPVDTQPAVALAPKATEAAQSGDIADQGGGKPPPISDACQNALRLRPHCLAAMQNELTKCGGRGKIHCGSCLKAHADEEGISA